MRIKLILKGYLEKVEKLRRDQKGEEIIEVYAVIDMLICWLRYNKAAKR